MTHALLLIVALGLAAPSHGWTNTTEGTITISVDLSNQPHGEEVQLWLPYPSSDSAQEITHITIDGDYTHSAIHKDKKFQTPMLFVKWEAAATNRFLTLSFKARRNEVTTPTFPLTEPSWDKADYSFYLRSTPMAPIDGDLAELAGSITKGKKGVLEKARAIYDWTVENTTRNPEIRGCGSGNVRALLKNPCGKCADISSIFIALCRAVDVPAREILGLRMGQKSFQDITQGQHCWAEFFLPGFGWVPVDPADVRKKMLVNHLDLNDPATAVCREFFFGGIDAYRVKLGHGRGIQPDPEPFGGTIDYLMYPFAQVGSQTIDWLDPENFTYSISFVAAQEADLTLSNK